MKPPNRVGHPFGGCGNDALVFGVSCYPLGLNLGAAGNAAGAALTGYAALALGGGFACAVPERRGFRVRGGCARRAPAGTTTGTCAATAVLVSGGTRCRCWCSRRPAGVAGRARLPVLRDSVSRGDVVVRGDLQWKP